MLGRKVHKAIARLLTCEQMGVHENSLGDAKSTIQEITTLLNF